MDSAAVQPGNPQQQVRPSTNYKPWNFNPKKTLQYQWIRDTFVCVKLVNVLLGWRMARIPSCVSSIIMSQICINFTRSMLWCWFILCHLIYANYMNTFFTGSQLGATFCHQLTTAIIPGQSTKGFMAIEPFNTRMRIRKSSLGSGRVMVDPTRGLHVYDLPQVKLMIFLCIFYGNHRSTNNQPLCDSPLYPQPAPCHGLWHISRDDGVLQVVGGVLEQGEYRHCISF